MDAYWYQSDVHVVKLRQGTINFWKWVHEDHLRFEGAKIFV